MLSRTEETNNEAVHQFTSRLQQDFHTALQQLTQAGEAMKRFADRRRRDEPVYSPGDLVLLSTRYLRMRNGPAKLQRRFVGPFRVETQISRVAYRLELPAPMAGSSCVSQFAPETVPAVVLELSRRSSPARVLKSMTVPDIRSNAFCAGVR